MIVLSATEVYYLLANLCVDLGFCLPPNAISQLQQTPPTDVDSFTDAVFRAEGFDPEYADRKLRAQVRAMVSAAFDRASKQTHK